MKQSMTDVAYEFLKEGNDAMPFIELWTRVSHAMGFNESQFDDNIAQFYTDLSIDGRFFSMPGNSWDLRSRHTYSESVMDTDSIAIDEDGDESEELLDPEEETKEVSDEEES
ncbi:DNA-directed RNA polymerase subunit delta [Faecalicoccus acidiformans]|uniref:RNAP delta factor n=1 Tax=Faecalicoccus acidiformans TaxID=915173 RepID=A0A7W8D1U3_9FIRM|nr:DNA-directed RNA polymerase subunit delta [Faecalicoccus acidiformans]MBB5184399.1 DNA-directed RNA polymerase subunit delta [Faecalicoccus acidiformans]MBM6831751.1 DNA-directed RNA polymerase subunit delta [Faecalicoccus acidiformans]MDM8203808.1 DNA-directed RNA polymerase subunit delta [Faecalicoccus acidiformans]HIW18863.1 DNA-directed RNA polymerase subunit delta [Candidatus Faecalicoccus intestinipullorum]